MGIESEVFLLAEYDDLVWVQLQTVEHLAEPLHRLLTMCCCRKLYLTDNKAFKAKNFLDEVLHALPGHVLGIVEVLVLVDDLCRVPHEGLSVCGQNVHSGS